MRSYFLFRSFVLFFFSISPIFSVQALEYSDLNFKVWIWEDSIQIQFIEPVSGDTAMVFFEYNLSKTYITGFEHSFLSRDGVEVHPIIARLISSPHEVKKALAAANDINKLKAINFNGPRDYTLVREGDFDRDPVFKNGVFLGDDEMTKPERKALNAFQTLKEKDFYRLRLLLRKIYSAFDPDAMAKASEQNICDQHLAAN